MMSFTMPSDPHRAFRSLRADVGFPLPEPCTPVSSENALCDRSCSAPGGVKSRPHRQGLAERVPWLDRPGRSLSKTLNPCYSARIVCPLQVPDSSTLAEPGGAGRHNPPPSETLLELQREILRESATQRLNQTRRFPAELELTGCAIRRG